MDDLQTLPLDQKTVCRIAADLWTDVIRFLAESWSVSGDDYLRSLQAAADHKKATLKKVELPVSGFLSAATKSLEGNAQLDRMKEFDECVGQMRGVEAGAVWLDSVFNHCIPEAPAEHIWVPGVGYGADFLWLRAKFPDSQIALMDHDGDAIRSQQAKYPDSGCDWLETDLTQASGWPEGSPDLVFWTHPFIIEHRAYEEFVRSFAQLNLTQQDHVTGNIRINESSALIFEQIFTRLGQGTLLLATMDKLEAFALRNSINQTNVKMECFRNPFPLKTAASLMRSHPLKEWVAPRHFSYLFKFSLN